MTYAFFDVLDELCDKLNIEDYDREVLHDFAQKVHSSRIAAQVRQVNAELLTSYLVWDVLLQEFRLYKMGVEYDRAN